MQPKTHKKDKPGRPVVNSVNCHTSGISKYVDYRLQAIAKDFLTKLNHVRHIAKENLLVTLDVKSLYTNIPNNEGIKAVREAQGKHPSKSVSTKVAITFLSLSLTLNNFIFNCSHYLQVMACAMDTICAPAYANIFMVQFEAKHIYPWIHGKALLFLRYIDDIFMICNRTPEELILFIDELNKKHKIIKFDYKISTKQIQFMDTMVYRDQQRKIQIMMFRKPTDQQTYLHAQSNHRKSLKNSIPYSQALRIKTICSTTSEFNKNCDIITERYKERG